MSHLTTAAQLYQIENNLTDRDRIILVTLRTLRFAKTDQLQRLFYPQVIDKPYAAIRATRRNLARLQNLGLILHLPQIIGGVRAGAQGMVWYLTELGARLLDLGTEQEGKRKRRLSPSSTFLRHTIAVTETYVQITEYCRTEPNMKLVCLEVEPRCWRGYEKAGKQISLRPDLYAETVADGYLYSWFLEMDLGTETGAVILEKCRRYLEYYRTGKEQHATGVFPIVLFIVPTAARKQKIVDDIKNAFAGRNAHIFLVVTPAELHRILKTGAQEEKLC